MCLALRVLRVDGRVLQQTDGQVCRSEITVAFYGDLHPPARRPVSLLPLNLNGRVFRLSR